MNYNFTEENVDQMTEKYIKNLKKEVKELKEKEFSFGEKMGFWLLFGLIFFVGMRLGSYISIPKTASECILRLTTP